MPAQLTHYNQKSLQEITKLLDEELPKLWKSALDSEKMDFEMDDEKTLTGWPRQPAQLPSKKPSRPIEA